MLLLLFDPLAVLFTAALLLDTSGLPGLFCTAVPLSTEIPLPLRDTFGCLFLSFSAVPLLTEVALPFPDFLGLFLPSSTAVPSSTEIPLLLPDTSCLLFLSSTAVPSSAEAEAPLSLLNTLLKKNHLPVFGSWRASQPVGRGELDSESAAFAFSCFEFPARLRGQWCVASGHGKDNLPLALEASAACKLDSDLSLSEGHARPLSENPDGEGLPMPTWSSCCQSCGGWKAGPPSLPASNRPLRNDSSAVDATAAGAAAC
mmetsp:Transcript_19146/g.35812  ORF Transcript_19146/g.35812 Transcript_19146/m.35812 type:complete len:258 (-) Transcript_19146:94-867(-)